MNRLQKLGVLALSPVLLGAAESLPDIVVAEQAEPAYVILSLKQSWDNPEARVWSWNPVEDKQLFLPCSNDPEKRPCNELFRDPSEVKPVLDGTHLLVTASYGGAALIRIADKRVIWHVYPHNNPHSAALLPDGNVVTASSNGSYLRLFNLAKYNPADPGSTPMEQYFADDAHGVVWDAKRERLWSSGRWGICEWQYHADSEHPALKQVGFYPMIDPEPRGRGTYLRLNGHDLVLAPDGDQLFMTAGKAIYCFDLRSRSYSISHTLANIKSISIFSGRELMLEPTESWWSPAVFFPDDKELSSSCHLPGAKIYKARWILRSRQSR